MANEYNLEFMAHRKNKFNSIKAERDDLHQRHIAISVQSEESEDDGNVKVTIEKKYEEENQETTRLSLREQVARSEAEQRAKEKRRRNSERLRQSQSYAAEKRYRKKVEEELKVRKSQQLLKSNLRNRSMSPALMKEQEKKNRAQNELAERAKLLRIMKQAD